MRRKKRPFWLLAISLLSFVLLGYLINFYSPDWKFEIGNLKLEILILFFSLFFIFISSLFSFLLNNTRRGIFTGTFTTIYLLLRFLKLTQPFFLIILFALFIALELVFSRK